MKPRRSRVAVAFEEFERGMRFLESRRTCDCELAGWWSFVESALLHIRRVLADLETVDLEWARQAYFGVLLVEQILRREVEMVNPARLARGIAICARMLDALTPYVTIEEHAARKLVAAGIDCFEVARSDAN